MAAVREGVTRIAVAIPAYQAVYSIASVIDEARAVIGDLLVIDDGSTDGTGEAARAAGAEVQTLPANRGKGAALRAAFTTLFERGFDAVVTLDADGQHLPGEVPHLIAASEDADLVLGTRDHLFAEMGAVRRLSNSLSSRAISSVAGQRISDVQTGFRLYRRELIARTGFPETGFEAESAVIVRAVRLGLRVVTTPVRLGRADGRGTSHYRPVTDSLRIAVGVLRARFGSRG
jgi:glycosyltransferase involved in cell wall biosynthesis